MHKSLRDYMRRAGPIDDVARCAHCGGFLMLLGALGNMLHTRCRDCGMTFSEQGALADVDEEPADWTNERD